MEATAGVRLRGAPVIHDTIDGETIAINQRTGRYYSLDGPAAVIWQALASGTSRARLLDELAARYDASPTSLEAELDAFLAELRAEDLVVDDPASAGGPVAPDAGPSPGVARQPFTGLALHHYSDMEVLLLADPIHEVDETGWPTPPPETA